MQLWKEFQKHRDERRYIKQQLRADNHYFW
jgi:hypothetical protein